MAMVDDPDWLLSHIQHSFITSDDTGMCEMVIQDNDLLTLEEHCNRMKEIYNLTSVKQKLSGSYGKTSGLSTSKKLSEIGSCGADEGQFVPLAPSPDITSGWDFGIRRRSNTAQKLERIRKERQNRVKIKTVHWKDLPERFMSEDLDAMFAKKDKLSTEEVLDGKNVEKNTENNCESNEILSDDKINHLFSGKEIQLTEKSVPVKANVMVTRTGFDVNEPNLDKGSANQTKKTEVISTLSKQLSETVSIARNPFKEYSKFDGRGHEASMPTQKINMFIWLYGETAPVKPMTVVILSTGAKIVDLIGLSCWQYFAANLSPCLKRIDVQGYSLHIAEDDGEVDYGFPSLESNEPINKFSFPTLALVEKHQVGESASDDGKFRESVFVRVNDYAGFSLIQVENLSVTMGEILKKAIKRRKGNKYTGNYILEYMDKPGVTVDEEQTLDSTTCMEFYMLREHSARSRATNLSPPKVETKTNTKGQSVHFSNRLTS